MEKRRLGRSGLETVPSCSRNVLGWTVDQKSRTIFSINSSIWASTPSTPPTPIRVGCRATQRRIRNHHRNWLKTSGKRDRVLIMTKLGAEMGRTRRGCPTLY